MNAIDDRRHLAFQRLGRSDVGGNHEVLDHPVGVKTFAQRNLGDPSRFIQLYPPLGQLQLKRIAVSPRPLQGTPRFPQVHQMRCRVTFIDPALCIFIGNHFVDADQGTRKAPVGDLAAGGNGHVAGHGGPILARPQRADIGAEHFGQHRHHPVGEVGRIAAFAR